MDLVLGDIAECGAVKMILIWPGIVSRGLILQKDNNIKLGDYLIFASFQDVFVSRIISILIDLCSRVCVFV